MKIVGIIAEYNPFHKGHKFHIEKAKEITGADAVIVVMSGDYVQRGMPAIMPKHLRTEMALACGADAVLELPVCYATGSAEYFATGAVSLLDSLGCVDFLCFGSESGKIELLQQIADVLCKEPDNYKVLLQKYLKNGNTFPAARKLAITDYLLLDNLSADAITPDFDINTDFHSDTASTINEDSDICTNKITIQQISEILDSPNNILGIEYLKALSCLKSSITPVTITREGAGYHDQTLGGSLSSASAIRHGLQYHELNNKFQTTDNSYSANLELETIDGNIDFILSELPEACQKIFKENYHKCFPVFTDDFSLLLKAKLLTETKESLTQYLDITPEIANRIITFRNDFMTFSQFCDLIKTKNVTYSRISRCLIHILLGIYKCDVPDAAADSRCSYARVLGFRKESSWVLSSIKKSAKIPIITKLPQINIQKSNTVTSAPEFDISSNKSEAEISSDNIDFHMLSQNIFSSDLFESVVTDKYHSPFKNEYQKQIIRF